MPDDQKIRFIYDGSFSDAWIDEFRPSNGKFRLHAHNAHDAGFRYAMLDREKSSNIDGIDSGDIIRQPIPLKDHFRYNDKIGANNIAAIDQPMIISLLDYSQATTIYVRLWWQEPATLTTPEDYAYAIEVHPTPNINDYGLDEPYNPEKFDATLNLIDIAINLFLPVLLLMLGFFIGRYQEKRHYRSIHRREKALLHIPAITSSSHDTSRGIESVQLVFGSTAISVDYFKRLMAFFRYIIGGEVKSYSPLLDRGRREAILRMKESCPDYHIFLNYRLQTSTITTGKHKRVACVEVIAYATAIRYKS